MLTRIHSLFYGLSLPFRAAVLIASRPSLMAWSALPVAVTMLLDYSLIHWVNAVLRAWVESHVHGFAAGLVLLLTKILLFVVAALSFSFLTGIVATPFNDFLAEASEKWASPPMAPVKAHSFLLRTRLILLDAAKTLAAASVGLAALFLSWIPLINLIALVLEFLLLSFQFISYPQTRRGEGLGSGVHFLGRHLFACAGFGAMLMVLFSIPLVSCLAFPLAVVGGTLLVARAGASAHSWPPLK